MEILGCDAYELDALVLDKPDVFDIDRLPVIHGNFKRYLAKLESEKTKALFT
jgi:hypothetical protein